MKIFEFIEIQYDKLSEQVNTWLKKTYNKNDIIFTSASPYGQILNVIKTFYQQLLLQLKQSISVLTLDADTINDNYLKGYSRLSGHIPSRAISASGVINIKLKVGIDITTEVKDGKILLNNHIKIKNKSNNLFYTLYLSDDNITLDLNQIKNFYFIVKQGQYLKDQFTGNGEINQIYTVNTNNTSQIDNFDIIVKYNSNVLSIKNQIFDQLKDELSCVIRTGINGGIEILFGNNNFGFIPKIGSTITVSYLLTNGQSGNIYTNNINDFQYIDQIVDNANNPINMEDIFDTYISNDIIFGSDGENKEFTKNILPYVSRNFVLASPSQFIYHLKKLNIFSKINVYNKLDDNDNTNDNQVYLYLVPKISNYFNDTVNYFNIREDIFYLSKYEKDKIMSYLKLMGILQLNSKVIITQPRITKYVMFINVVKYSDSLDEIIKQDIVSVCSDFFIHNERIDRISKSEIISLLTKINGIDSIDLVFISKDNEDNYIKTRRDNSLGLDSVLGDIIIKNDELPILRGGWKDRREIYYHDVYENNKLNSININIKGITYKNKL